VGEYTPLTLVKNINATKSAMVSKMVLQCSAQQRIEPKEAQTKTFLLQILANTFHSKKKKKKNSTIFQEKSSTLTLH
jgi:hypothetical protein